MAELPPAPTEIDPTFKASKPNSYNPRPLGSDSFTGMVNNVRLPRSFRPLITTNIPLHQSATAVEARYRSSISTEGPTNLSGGRLYRDRLAANIELSKDPNRGYNAWNAKRQAAIARGEDPNSEMLEMMEDRKPDSYVERAWRKVMGKGRTKREERERREEKERRRREREGKGELEGAVEVDGRNGGEESDDGVIR